MPTYDYKCNACGDRSEVFQSMRDAPKRKCPKCGKNALERLIGTGAAVLFKGSGFYQTDYRSDAYKKAAESDSKSTSTAPATESSPAKTADSATAPAPKTDPKPAPATETRKSTEKKKSAKD
ncbi:MAG: hypothetical protein KF745_04415 [Phycisphaeraceae bacterium]|nr:hypothetical protein [Phycisphaeraceae bacterium]